MGCNRKGGSATIMVDAANLSGNYRIEVSSWDLNDAFFVEKSELQWTEGSDKKLLLRHAVPEGAVIFARLMAPENPFGSVPVAYQVKSVQPMNSFGLCELRLLRLHPRSRAHSGREIASPSLGYSSKTNEPKESSSQPELEEVLYEA
jgi:hypothetical protein